MSDLEKDAYAWMGVSPLIKLEQEIRNPRTAIVTIVPLGTLPEPTPEIITAVETNKPLAAETFNVVEPIPLPLVFDYDPEPVVESVPSLPVVMPEEVAVVEEETSAELANRRRRRRSSAIVD
jgi:ribonuclease E